MTNVDSQHYFERRAEEERTAAERAVDSRAAQSHRELAAYYRSLALGHRTLGVEEAGPADAGTMPREFRIVP